MYPSVLILLYCAITVTYGAIPDWDVHDYCFIDIAKKREIPSLKASDMDKIIKLEQVQVVHRHGARTDAKDNDWCQKLTHDYSNCQQQIEKTNPTFNIEIEKNDDYGQCDQGWLLETGYKQLQACGSAINSAYVNVPKENSKAKLSTADLTPESTYFYSTWYERTKMSAHGLISAAFPHLTDITFHSRPSGYSLIVNPTSHICSGCIRNAEKEALYQEIRTRPNVTDFNRQLVLLTGFQFREVNYWDCIVARLCDGMTMPENWSNEFMQQFEQLTYEGFAEEVQKLDYQIDLVRGLLGLVYDKLQVRETIKFAEWSAHDDTVARFLAVLGIWDQKWPSYGSLVTMEIYNIQEEAALNRESHAFRVTYNNQTMRVPNCPELAKTELCPLSVLTDLLEANKWDEATFRENICVPDEECPSSVTGSLNTSADDFYGKTHVGYMITVGFIVVIFIVIIARKMYIARKQTMPPLYESVGDPEDHRRTTSSSSSRSSTTSPLQRRASHHQIQSV